MSSDWNEEFTKLVRQSSLGEAGVETEDAMRQAPSEPAVEQATRDSTHAGPDSDEAAASRRTSIAETLVQLRFIAADHATPSNPAVQVLTELLPLDAKVELCLTCHEFSCSGLHEFTCTTGRFPDPATMRHDRRYPESYTLVKGPRRDLVLCTHEALCWTQSRARSEGEDNVTLYSVPFTDILGANVRHRHKAVVDVYVDEGPTLFFRVERDVADALQAQVDQGAQSE